MCSHDESMNKKILKYTSIQKSPGPAAYKLKPTIGPDATDPSIENNPKISIKGRYTLETRPVGPGPVHHVENLNEYGKHRVTGGLMSGRYAADGRRDCGPGPANYNVGPVLRSNVTPRMACTGTPPPPPRHVTPGPNAYRLPDTLGHRSARLGARLEQRLQCPTPAPGYYDVPDVYKPGRAGYSFGRPIAARKAAVTPGPGHYDPTRRINCCRCEPYGKCGITFGRRWPDTVPVFAVKADDQHEC